MLQKTKVKPDGTAPVYFSIRIGKEKLPYTGKSIRPDLINNKGGGEITNKKVHAKLNLYLENEKNKLNAIILDLQYKKVTLSFEKVIGLY